MENYLTTLVSPDFPDHYPPKTRREWSFDIPPGAMGHIKVNILQVEHFWDPLTLTHSSETAHGTNVTTFPLVSGNLTSLLLPEGVVTVRFCSDGFLLHAGFAFEVRTLRVNDTGRTNDSRVQACLTNTLDFMCRSGMQFIDVIARCDKVVDCHDFSDESGCLTPDVECPYRCRDTDICLLDRLRCDGWYDCPQRDDEENCEIVKCPDGYVCGEAPFNEKDSPTNFCEERDWQPFWVNATKAWKKDNINSTAKKAVILNMIGIPLTLEVGSFKGLHNINNLYLASCELTYLPPGVFDGLFRLYILELENNRLTVLGEGLFRNLHYLGVLTLTSNYVTRFEDGCFQDLQNLFAIDLKNNSITEFSPGTFKDLGNSFQRLILKWNQLTSINASLFYGIETELLRANLGESLIEHIEPGTFKNLSKVTDLVITSLSPKSIPLYPEIFEGPGQFICCKTR
eukprot:XP_011668073.1 PREDICTED: relaxin receptor 1-like [Strongylocentrotus purpuratus]